MRQMQSRNGQRGVTLIELMIVVVILAIIAAIAIPSYRQQVLRSNRSDAKVALMQTVQNLERCFTRDSTYTGCVVLPVASPEGLYSVTAGEDDVEITGTTYRLTATPQAGQAQDTVCGNFTIDEDNDRGITGTGTEDECW